MTLRAQCGSSEHTAIQFVAIILVILWPIGMLSFFVWVLVYNRRELHVGHPKHPFAKASKFLTGGYKNQ